ncbi:MAG: patatin-like phospholipase family protein [Proteobacteria bacterium]|nr:patatin-like phospholipase family protein [Pseudomonadota bacterium]MDA1355951.1 patatin-like phospholipase family protein [Pseudomonadota bacterium]
MPSEIRGLVIQGGGMRGIYSAGAVSGLADAGLAHSFAHIYASSSGAINAAYLMSEQTDLVAAGYADHLNSDSPFIRYWRLNKMVDIDFLIDNILRHSEFPLNVKAVIDSPTILHVILTEFMTARPFEISSKDVAVRDSSGNLLFEVFRATAALPVFYNRVIEIDGKKFVDGGISDAIPLIRAIEAGCTDIIVVTTRNSRFRRERTDGLKRCLGRLVLARHPRSLSDKLLDEDGLFNKTMNLLQERGRLGGDLRITWVAPSDESRLVGRTTRGRARLWDCAQMGRDDAIQALGVSVP